MDFLPYDIETVRNERAEEYYKTIYKPKIGQNKQSIGESDHAFRGRQAKLKIKKSESDVEFEIRRDTLGRKPPESDQDWAIRKAELEDDNRAEALDKAALNWPTGKVISLAYKLPGQEIECVYDAPERDILKFWGNLLESNRDLQTIGKNSSTFDAPYLTGRFLANDMGVPASLRKVAKFGVLTDVDHMFSRYRNQTYTLDTYGYGLGIDGKGDVDGSMIHDLYFAEGGPKWDVIVPYNKQDVAVVVEMLRRFRPFEKSSGALFDNPLFG